MTETNSVTEKKKMYVDDEILNVLIFKSLFAKEYKIMTAPSGEPGLETLLMAPDISVIFTLIPY